MIVTGQLTSLIPFVLATLAPGLGQRWYVFLGQSVKGSFISTLGDIDETLDFAKRGCSETCGDAASGT
ncbi:hypothetical protein VMCG_04935 [Cytospora schulzeri]|uniref:ABC transmembrane type-1 domain-containing protein n=1 Tax=Cytospora schulzeri TaxID=448051 RepID=A0A423WM62_9PEZI|nr:hypothetical protein VMCG_04935 [Valsa malicola]